MGRPTRHDQETGFMRSFWDAIRTMEADYHGTCDLRFSAMPRPGVVTIRLSFVPFLEGEKNFIGSAAVQVEFPSAADRTLAGTLFYLSQQLDRTLGDGFTRR